VGSGFSRTYIDDRVRCRSAWRRTPRTTPIR